MMEILLFLLGIIAVNSVTITYPDQISDFDYQASNPDESEGPYAFLDDACKLLQVDSDTTTGCQVKSKDTPIQYTWGIGPGEQGPDGTVGMRGNFYATDVNPGTNPATGNAYTYYTITSMTISFTGGCLNDMTSITDDSTIYYTRGGTSMVTTDYDVTASKSNGVTTFSLVNPSYGEAIQLFAGEDIGFTIQTNSYCEAGMEVTEFTLEGEPAETAEPTKAPTPEPSPSPTTGEPTMAPTSQCKGEVTWGDPHFRLMAFDNDAVDQFNYQALGWFFYIAPCDMTQFEYFPFFLLSYHTRCYWRGNPKGCINNNRLILNTDPSPIVITFDYKNLEIEIPDDIYIKGSVTISPNALKGNGEINTNGNYKDKDGKRLEIEYNDGNSISNTPKKPNQSGKFVLFYDGDTIVIQLYNVKYDALPRRCEKNTKKGEDLECGENTCEDLVIDIRNQATWTYFTCPHCLRNIACGLMGKYYRGDCTQNQMNDPNDLCSQILVGVDGTVYTDDNGRARGDTAYGQMADTWAYDYVTNYLSTLGYTINFAKEKNTIFKHKKTISKPEGRSLDITDASYYDGYCKNNMTHIKLVNETCRQETVVKYDKCCKEIGICKILWLTCIEDYCSCTEPDSDKPANITDSWCLDTIIKDSMNTTCSVDALWPTSTPTAAPTPSPTGLVAGLPQGQKAQDLIWLYLIFVVLFVVIAGVAYWYYRKKNMGGKASFQDDVDSGVPNTGVGY